MLKKQAQFLNSVRTSIVVPSSSTYTQINSSHRKYIPIYSTKFVVGEDDGKDIFCDYTVFAERRTHDKLQVEYKGLTPADYPGDNTEYALGGWDYAEHKGEPKSSDL